MNSRPLLWAGGILAGVGVALAAPRVIANFASSPGLRTLDNHRVTPQVRPVSEESFLVVIGRRSERTHLEDPTDFRNSRIAVYQRGTDGWEIARGPLPVRSHSTNPEPPIFSTLDEARGHRWEQFGYQSVPIGIFTLTEIAWRNDNVAFLISDHGRTDGIISLSEPQVIRTVSVVEDQHEERGFRLEIGEQAIRSSWTKSESALHPTHTMTWSHGDSKGCINLYQPNVPIGDPRRENTPWQTFLGWLDEFEMRGDGRQLVLVLAPWDAVSDESGESLASELPLNFHRQFSVNKGRPQ